MPTTNGTYLVEEQVLGLDGNETVSRHYQVTATTAADAMARAGAEAARQPRGPFMFSPDELVEVVPGYLWGAADGSMIAYEVRYLGGPSEPLYDHSDVAPRLKALTDGLESPTAGDVAELFRVYAEHPAYTGGRVTLTEFGLWVAGTMADGADACEIIW